jgi:hypothetical protein
VYAPANLGAGTGGTTQNTLGSDVWGDPQFQGTIYELRIWNGVVSQRYLAASAIVGPSVLITNLNPTSMSLGAVIPNLVVTGTEPLPTVTVKLPQTGASPLEATLDATWTSSNTNILAVNSSSGLISGVGPGTATVTAHLGSFSQTSGPITVGPQVLQNRYSFVSDASDSVGGANGTNMPPNGGTAATIANGLTLPGGGNGTFSGYVQLPNGILTNDQSLTIECWATQAAQNIWATIWAFGIGPNNNFGFCPYPNRDNFMPNVEFNPPGVGEVDLVANSLFPVGTEQYFTVTYNNSTLVSSLYTNGVLEDSLTLPSGVYAPANLGAGTGGTTQNTLGSDVWNDPQFQGTIYELRIWNGVVSQRYLAASAIVGPSVLITNLNPTSMSLGAVISNLVVGGTEPVPTVTVTLPQTGTNQFVATLDATWTSSNTNILAVTSSSGLIYGVGPGTATVIAHLGSSSESSGSITVVPPAIAPTNLVASLKIIGGVPSLVINGAGGSGSGYTVLTSTNLVGNNWVTNSTGVFGADGSLSFTNAINPAIPQLFYRIRVP